MSGFVTTMFVPSSVLNSPAAVHVFPADRFPAVRFPAKSKPVGPVFTFAQSQSCMNLGIMGSCDTGPGATNDSRGEIGYAKGLKEGDAKDARYSDRQDQHGYTKEQHGHTKDVWTERSDGRFESLALGALAPAKPQLAYKSPLQRLGQALRTQAGATTSSLALDTDGGLDARFPPPTPQTSPNLESPSRELPNFSFKLIHGGARSPTREDISRDWEGCSGSGSGSGQTLDTNTVSSPYTRAKAAPKNNGYFGTASLLSSLFSNPRTRAPFKPQKAGRGTSSWQLKQYAEATLGSGSLRKAVKLPEGEDRDEWLAVNVVDFYNQINLLYGSITEFCSPQSCPEMKATDEFEYLWQDSTAFKKPTKMSAPDYIEHLMTWVQSNIDNDAIFPSRIGVPFPKTFPALLKNIFKRLYRVYAHIYCHHYPVVIELGLEPHLNTSFKHYVLFVDEHGLSQGSKDFWGPLGDLVESMLRSD